MILFLRLTKVRGEFVNTAVSCEPYFMIFNYFSAHTLSTKLIRL